MLIDAHRLYKECKNKFMITYITVFILIRLRLKQFGLNIDT